MHSRWLILSTALQADGSSGGARCSQPSITARQAAALAGPAPVVPDVVEPSSSAPRECEAADLEDILKEKGECGVGPQLLAMHLIVLSPADLCHARKRNKKSLIVSL